MHFYYIRPRVYTVHLSSLKVWSKSKINETGEKTLTQRYTSESDGEKKQLPPLKYS